MTDIEIVEDRLESVGGVPGFEGREAFRRIVEALKATDEERIRIIAAWEECLQHGVGLLERIGALEGRLELTTCTEAALNAELAVARENRRQAEAEMAAAILFLETELHWESFRAEGFLGQEMVASSDRNCQKLAAYLKERGNHGAGLLKELAELREDRERLNWMQSEITDTIYLDDGRIVDVAGGNVRAKIDAARKGTNAD